MSLQKTLRDEVMKAMAAVKIRRKKRLAMSKKKFKGMKTCHLPVAANKINESSHDIEQPKKSKK